MVQDEWCTPSLAVKKARASDVIGQRNGDASAGIARPA